MAPLLHIINFSNLCFRVENETTLISAKNRVDLSSISEVRSYITEWPRFFGPPCMYQTEFSCQQLLNYNCYKMTCKVHCGQQVVGLKHRQGRKFHSSNIHHKSQIEFRQTEANFQMRKLWELEIYILSLNFPKMGVSAQILHFRMKIFRQSKIWGEIGPGQDTSVSYQSVSSARCSLH